MSAQQPRIALLAITRGGARHAVRLSGHFPEAHLWVPEKRLADTDGATCQVHSYDGPLRPQVKRLFEGYDQLVCFVAIGGVVRLIAPHLKSKETDPGVLVVDEAACFVVPVLSGHLGGANAFAQQVAHVLEATPVITTASESGGTLAVDLLGRELGWRLEAPKINVTRVSAHLVNREPVALIQEAGRRDWVRPDPLPDNIQLFDRFEEVDRDAFHGLLWITRREVPAELWNELEERLVVYRPPEA